VTSERPARRHPARPAILAVDGGGTKVDAALLRRDGTVLGAARVRSQGYDETGDERFLDQIDVAVKAACADAGLDGAAQPVAGIGVYCLAGADLPADDRRIAKGLVRRGWSARDVLRNDTFAVLRAGTDRDWGVGLVCGTGVNCSGVAPGGRNFRFPAVGGISGDWGGGWELGEQALWWAIRAEDGRGPATSLRSAVPRAFGFRRPRQVMEALYFRRLDPDRIPELAPVLFAEAGGGDAIARSIVDRQADEIVSMAGVAIRRLRMTRRDPDVVLGGGVFRTTDEPFFERIRAGLAEVCPGARMRVLTAPPVLGAAMLGLDLAEASKAAHARARAALTHERLTAETRHGR
jgi:N-acetylglucosamine kinase-like BadF-type ATPase